MEFQHTPVLLKETVEGLNIQPDGIYVDGTLGGGGHSLEIVKRLTTGKLIGIDQDECAIQKASETLSEYSDKVCLVKGNYRNIKKILKNLNIQHINGALLDIGVSSYQFDEGRRGFSFHEDAILDMRMDQGMEKNAKDIVNSYTLGELTEIFWKYGEENWGKRIAEFIVEERRRKPIETTLELVDIIKKAIPKRKRQEAHPARKVFQALRIEVNDELNALRDGLYAFIDVLQPNGRLAIITFHSLEDRIVKQSFKDLARDCICPADFPICVCNHRAKIEIVNTKPIVAGEKELRENQRSRSAKLRIAQRKQRENYHDTRYIFTRTMDSREKCTEGQIEKS